MRVVAALVAALVMLAPGAARADEAEAKQLFDQGKALFAEGRFADACPKLEASFKMNRLSGTRGLLAACYERVGRLASAWNAYRDAAALAERANNPERAKAARDKAAELQPRLAYLTIAVPDAARVPELEVVLDGEVLPDAALAGEVPVDAGPHIVSARATEYKPWHESVEIVDGERKRVAVPVLVVDPTERLAREARARDLRSRIRRRKVIAFSIGGAGTAAVGVAAVVGLLARSQWNDAKDAGCNSDGNCPDEASRSTAAAAGRKADLATILGGAGLALVGAGIAVYLTIPSERAETAPRITPKVGAGQVGLAIEGRF